MTAACVDSVCVLSGAALWPVVTFEGPGHNPLAWCAPLSLNCSSSHGPHYWARGAQFRLYASAATGASEKQTQQQCRQKFYLFLFFTCKHRREKTGCYLLYLMKSDHTIIIQKVELVKITVNSFCTYQNITVIFYLFISQTWNTDLHYETIHLKFTTLPPLIRNPCLSEVFTILIYNINNSSERV